MRPLAERVALVTGAGRGIGRAVAERLARDGAVVVINDVDADVAREVTDGILAADGRATCAPGSVVSTEVAAAIVDLVRANHGRLDVLINNAGVTRAAMVHRMTDEDWNFVLDVSLRGTFNMCRAAASLLRGPGHRSDGRNRKVVNVSSINGIYGTVANANYSAAKAGVIGLTRALAREWAPSGVNVNAVAPGYIAGTRLTSPQSSEGEMGMPAEMIEEIEASIPIGRPGTPADVAGVCAWLASADSDYVCGQVVEVHGGMELVQVKN